MALPSIQPAISMQRIVATIRSRNSRRMAWAASSPQRPAHRTSWPSTRLLRWPCTPFPTPVTPIAPLGDLIYTGSDSHVLTTSTDVNCLSLALNAGGTLTLVGTPTTSALQLSVSIIAPDGSTVVASATAPAAGKNVVIETAPVATTGTYEIKISDAGGNLGLYSIQAYLNTY